jgi:hypothetical protein
MSAVSVAEPFTMTIKAKVFKKGSSIRHLPKDEKSQFISVDPDINSQMKKENSTANTLHRKLEHTPEVSKASKRNF